MSGAAALTGLLGATPVGIGLGAVGLASSIYGGIKSAQANKEAQQNIDKQENRAEAFYNNRVNRDYMDTNAAKGIVEQLRKRYEKQTKTIDSNTEAMGGTAEANIAAKTAANEQVNNAMNNVAQQATSYQEHGEDQYQNQMSDLARQRMALTMMKGEQATNLMKSGASLMGNGADIAALGKGGKLTGSGSLAGISPEGRANLNALAQSGTSKILKGSIADFSGI